MNYGNENIHTYREAGLGLPLCPSFLFPINFASNNLDSSFISNHSLSSKLTATFWTDTQGCRVILFDTIQETLNKST